MTYSKQQIDVKSISSVLASKPKLAKALDTALQQGLKKEEKFAYPVYFVSEEYHIRDDRADGQPALKIEPNTVVLQPELKQVNRSRTSMLSHRSSKNSSTVPFGR